MTENAARQPKGIPTGGQFAATNHAEPALNLASRRPELDGWPEHLPEPEVAVNIDDAGAISTAVSIEGEPVFTVWTPATTSSTSRTKASRAGGWKMKTSMQPPRSGHIGSTTKLPGLFGVK
ncbi:hypothetical protein [Paenarthrobacter sp. YJN-5]|uniref:hypothetical protein n=1 Tax=Paenarthrobacter sp. YJN-5 TaxID=2735316 RepID=UPI0018783455|nr:hypothetical protein [Paenarthrobacter sp. YJN-5]QOT19202.1 hypothetical protein HMI59_21995 [Paenarthrobacter sp. YJN-5]